MNLINTKIWRPIIKIEHLCVFTKMLSLQHSPVRTPGKSFFENYKLGLCRQIALNNVVVFSANLGFLSMSSIYQSLFLQKKLGIYIQIPKLLLGVEVEFGPERIRNLVIVCP